MAWKRVLLEGEAAILSDVHPVNVTTAAAEEGSATLASRDDHKHSVGDMTGMTADTILEKTTTAGVTVDTCLIKDGKVADSNLLEGSNKATVQDHTPKAHSLAAHDTPVGAVNCGQQQLDGLVPESAATAPDVGTEVAGQLYYNTTDKHIYQWVPA